MQRSFLFSQDQRFPEVLSRLHAAWPPKDESHADPLSQLIFMMLAANTPTAVALAAYRRLRSRYQRWSDVKNVAPDILLQVIRGVEGAVDKAVSIPRVLQEIENRHGLVELDFLAGWTTQAARDWLESLPGVDSLISAATLNFSTLRKTVLALDKSGARVVRRLGFINPGSPLSSLDRQIMDKIPSDWRAQEMSILYSGLHKLAGTYCHKGKPECKSCPLSDLCPTAKQKEATVLAFPSFSKKASQ